MPWEKEKNRILGIRSQYAKSLLVECLGEGHVKEIKV